MDPATAEARLIAATPVPVTVAGLTGQLAALGLATGDVAIVHTSLSALGWVAGGAQAVVEALLAAVGPTGTIVMPTHSGLSDPASWRHPPVPETWIATIRAEMPAFDRHLTPTRMMGQVVEVFRHHPATLRSGHPTLSFAANGPAAERIVAEHPLAPALGETSPLARLYELDAKVVLLGVGHGNDTSLHLAEHRATYPGKHDERQGSPIVEHGRRRWVEYDDLATDEDDFEAIGEAFARTGRERRGPIGIGVGRACSQRAIVDFAVEWMEANRSAGLDVPDGLDVPEVPNVPEAPEPEVDARA
jgi:aminoglycoside 3-N-acetyltransferase